MSGNQIYDSMVHCVIFYIYMYMAYTVCPKCITHTYSYGLDTYVNIRKKCLIGIIYVFTSYDYIFLILYVNVIHILHFRMGHAHEATL